MRSQEGGEIAKWKEEKRSCPKVERDKAAELNSARTRGPCSARSHPRRVKKRRTSKHPLCVSVGFVQRQWSDDGEHALSGYSAILSNSQRSDSRCARERQGLESAVPGMAHHRRLDLPLFLRHLLQARSSCHCCALWSDKKATAGRSWSRWTFRFRRR